MANDDFDPPIPAWRPTTATAPAFRHCPEREAQLLTERRRRNRDKQLDFPHRPPYLSLRCWGVHDAQTRQEGTDEGNEAEVFV